MGGWSARRFPSQKSFVFFNPLVRLKMRSTILLVRSRHYASNGQTLQNRPVGNSAPQLWLPDSAITFGQPRSFCISCLFPPPPTLNRETTQKAYYLILAVQNI